MVYYKGPSGWLSEKTNFKAETKSDPAFADFQVGETRLFLQYWPEKQSVELFGHRISVAMNNIVVVTGIRTPTPLVQAVSSFSEVVPDGENPALYVLERSPEAMKALE
jgi:hypothetical protein